MVSEFKEVLFDEFCKLCKHYDKDELEEPCCCCLTQSVNLYSHRPVKWEDKNGRGNDTRIKKCS